MQNVIKHARAKNIAVSLLQHPKSYTLEIQDDGVGFDKEGVIAVKGFKSGAGLANLQSRAKLISGSMEVRSAVGEGTTVTLTIPQDSTLYDNRSSD